MKLYFVTGSNEKFNEAKEIIPEIERLVMDLPEIQELDARKIIEAKLTEARKIKKTGELFCEDTSLYINCLNGLPGPLIKWFMKSLGNQRIYDLISRYSDRTAYAETVVGYSNEKGEILFFEGRVDGEIVAPSEEVGFGWDQIFRPNGYNVTFAQIGAEEKNRISHRGLALSKLRNYLNKR